MFARVRLITRDEQNALVIPEQAVVPQGDEQYVFRVADGRANRVRVELGQRRDGLVQVVRGLEPNDVIVTAGQLKIRDGAPVSVASGAQPAKAENVSAPAPKS
jgi:membrane fusion protein (multidrug efflux system)